MNASQLASYDYSKQAMLKSGVFAKDDTPLHIAASFCSVGPFNGIQRDEHKQSNKVPLVTRELLPPRSARPLMVRRARRTNLTAISPPIPRF